MATQVKAFLQDGSVCYYSSLTECCKAYGVRYEYSLKALIEHGGLAPDGRTFFDYPTDQELDELKDGRKLAIVERKGAKDED